MKNLYNSYEKLIYSLYNIKHIILLFIRYEKKARSRIILAMATYQSSLAFSHGIYLGLQHSAYLA